MNRLLKWCGGAFIFLLVALVAVHHVLAVFTESINWDEFGLFRLVQDSLATGVFRTGGRPGLAILLLIPLVDGCREAMQTATHARLLWLVFTIGYPVSLYLLLREFFGIRKGNSGVELTRSIDALLGVALLVFVPLWLRWSVQVRTDQPALFFVFLSGSLMMRSAKTAKLGLVSGVLAALGYLFSQKAIYGGGIVAVLVLVHAWVRGELFQPKTLPRLLHFFLGAAVTYGLFRGTVAAFFVPADAFTVAGGARHMQAAGAPLEYRLYSYVLPYLLPHGVLAFGLLAATLQALRGRLESYRELVASWSLLLLGVVVARFHTNGFAYFWLTIGCFPAAALAVSLGPLRELMSPVLEGRRLLGAVYCILALVLVTGSLPKAMSILEDTQAPQRASLSFVDRNFSRDAPGFQLDGALFCREKAGHFPVIYGVHLTERFLTPGNEKHVQDFIQKFRDLPVEFLIRTKRLDVFPPTVVEFWESSYLLYSSSVMVPGFRIQEGPSAIDVLVPGKYQWFPVDPSSTLRIGEDVWQAHATPELNRGPLSIESRGPGLLVLKLQEDSSNIGGRFYSPGSLGEISLRE